MERQDNGHLCNHRVSFDQRGIYRMTIRHALLYGEYWATKKRKATKVHVAEMCAKMDVS